jgi:hypothetical protein
LERISQCKQREIRFCDETVDTTADLLAESDLASVPASEAELGREQVPVAKIKKNRERISQCQQRQILFRHETVDTKGDLLAVLAELLEPTYEVELIQG